MKKFLVIFSVIIGFFFSTYVFAGETYSSLVDYKNNPADIDSSTIAHICGLARNYIKANSSSMINIHNSQLDESDCYSDNCFNYCLAIIPKNTSGKVYTTIVFSDTPFVSFDNGSLWSSGNTLYITLYYLDIYYSKGSLHPKVINNITYYGANCGNSTGYILASGVSFKEGNLSNITNNDYYTSCNIFDINNSSSIIYNQNLNYNYSSNISGNYDCTYDIHISGINTYSLHVTPIGIGTPYDLNINVSYWTENKPDLSWLCEEDVSTIVTTGFHVDLDVKRIDLRFSWSGGSYTKTINFQDDTINGEPIPQLADRISSLNAYSSYEFVPYDNSSPNGDGTYSVTTDIYTYQMKNGYHVYYDYDGTRNYIDLNYQFGTNEYQVVVNNLQKSFFEENGLTMYFYITDTTGNVFYTKRHTISLNGENSVQISNEGGLSNSDYNFIYGQPNSTYNGYFGNMANMNGIDISNFSVNDGVNAMTGFFTSVQDVFGMIIQFISFLPNWITIPITTLLILMIIITMIKLIRG